MLRFISLSLCLLAFISSSAFASPWQSIGSRSVTPRVETDTIYVSRARSDFRKLQLRVRGAGIDMSRMVVYFKSGSPFKVNMRSNIPQNGKSRVIDLPGKGRTINKVVFWYDAQSLGRRNATVTLFAR